jgi:FlaA1/EpsC-like NDP-sugar epimerase
VARHKPRKIILLENNATALFYAESELRDKQPGVDILAALGDVRDLPLLNRIFREEKPQIVFHAAAHKHVHQLETNIAEGVSNNLLGTYHLAAAADRGGAEAFILISTDKAVRPSCVMGATKRAAEIVVSNFARTSKTRFASVRFGNVLGSSGSVMRIFQQQIEKGQPLTLTHPEATRYFMTVQEAVGLVLQASVLAKGGEVFVLNMGEQIRIIDMARRLIWLSGLEPDRDVPIRVVGLRPGEKLAEEIMEDPLGHEPSEHPDILVLRSENREVKELADHVTKIELLTSTAEKEAMVRALTQLVPTFMFDPGSDGVRVAPVDDRKRGPSVN